MINNLGSPSFLVNQRRRSLVVGGVAALIAAAAARKALANANDKRILFVYDAQWITETMLARLLHYAGGARNLSDFGYEVAHLPVPVGNSAALQASITQVTSLPPSVLVVLGDDEALAFHKAFPQIPMVFWCNTDPTSTGLVQSFRYPGAAATGATSDWVENVKPLEFLSEIIGAGSVELPKRIGIFSNSYWFAEARRVAWSGAARAFGLQLEFVAADSYPELVATKAWQTVERFAAVILPLSTSTVTDDANIIRHLQDRRVLSLFENFTSLAAGAPLGYEHNRIDWQAQIGQTLGLIVQGELPGEIPVRGPEGWEYAVNKAALLDLGVALSPNVAAQIARVF